MPAKFNEAKIKIRVDESGARPAVHINPVGHVILHLTTGFVAASFPNSQGNAITGDAKLQLEGGIGDTEFGFVQVGRVNYFGAFYAGRTRSEGAVAVLAHTPPALPRPVLLDAIGTPPLPWFEDPGSISAFQPPTMTSRWGDHPGARVQTVIDNSLLSNTPNYLFHLIDDREFWTVYTVRDAGQPVRHLAHFHWQVRHDVKFAWRAGIPSVQAAQSFVKVHTRQAAGLPADAAAQAVLTAPREPRANVVFLAALRSAFRGAPGINRTEHKERFLNVPTTFWS